MKTFKSSKAKTLFDRKNAQHGEFFFVQFITNNDTLRKSPVFVLSNKIDSKDDDVVVCSCTKQPPKSQFDIPVQLRYKTYVRTNKIYTIRRNQLLFKIPQTAKPKEYENIIDKINLALQLNDSKKLKEVVNK